MALYFTKSIHVVEFRLNVSRKQNKADVSTSVQLIGLAHKMVSYLITKHLIGSLKIK